MGPILFIAKNRCVRNNNNSMKVQLTTCWFQMQVTLAIIIEEKLSSFSLKEMSLNSGHPTFTDETLQCLFVFFT